MWWKRASPQRHLGEHSPAEIATPAAPGDAQLEQFESANRSVRHFRRDGGTGRLYWAASVDGSALELQGSEGTLRLRCVQAEDARQVAALAALVGARVSLAVPAPGRWPLMVFSGATWTLYVPVADVSACS